MELTGILFLVMTLVGLGLFIYGLVKAFSGWGVFYTVTLVFLFLSSLGFLFASACVAQRRIGWVRIHDQAKDKVATLEKEVARLKFGDMNQPSSDLSSLLGLANELNRVSLERGRVWRNATLIDFAPDTIKLSLAPKASDAPADPDVPVAQAPEVNGELPAEAVVYAFGEGEGPEGRIVPKIYLGEFFVAESQGSSATLRPVAPLLPIQEQAIKSGEAGSWSLFDLMPLDSHVAFAEANSKRTNEFEFGRMDRKALAELFQIPEELLDRDPSQLSPEESRQLRLLRSYVLDGGRAPENEPPENVWSRVEFLVEHTVDVDDTEGERKSTDGGYFDFSGRAVDARLKRKDGKGEVVFRKGQQALFASKPAKDLIDRNICKLIEPVFVRRINDYALAFKETRDRITDANQDAAMIQREIDSTKATTDRAQQQVVFRQNERQLLDKDSLQYQKELAVITAEAARLEQAVQDSRAELSRLYQLTQQHYDRLVQTQRSLYQIATGSK